MRAALTRTQTQRYIKRSGKIMNSADTMERLAVVAAEPMILSPEEFSAHVKQEIAK